MDPYDLPEEFSHLQAQDMGKLGFMQDLIRGIKKIAKADEPKAKETVKAASEVNANLQALLDRGFMALEDGEWEKADDFFEQALNFDAKLAEAYLGKLMAELQVKRREDLKNCKEFEGSNNYKKVVRFGDEILKNELAEYIKFIKDRNENIRLTTIYNNAVSRMKSANTGDEYKHAAETFNGIKGFKDAEILEKECLEKVEICRKEEIYNEAKNTMSKHLLHESGNLVHSYELAIRGFESIINYKDAKEQIDICRHKIEEIKAKEEADQLEAKRKAEEKRIAKEKGKKLIIKTVKIATPIICACIATAIVLNMVIIPQYKYSKAMKLLDTGDFKEAYVLLGEVGKSSIVAQNRYDRAMSLIDSGNYEEAYVLLEGLDYKDSTDKLNSIKPQYNKIILSNAKVGSYIIFGSYEQDNDTTNGKEDIEWLVLSKEEDKVLVISKYALYCAMYENPIKSVTWEDCSLRKWLNGAFFGATFSDEEQNSIISTTVIADANPKYDTHTGNDTTDKVFLLSVTEVERYFSSNQERKCVPTAYAKAHGAWTSSSYSKNGRATCWWWLRTPGRNSSCTVSVSSSGAVNTYGLYANDGEGAVRPAMWISLE